jgi:hypothetical protein
MNDLIHFYEYSFHLSMKELSDEKRHHWIDPYESTLFGAMIEDWCEFTLFCDLVGCLDSEL